MTDDLLLAPHLQMFFLQHLHSNKRASGQTIAAYRDTFRLLLQYVQQTRNIEPSKLQLSDLDASTLLSFLDHLEKEETIAPDHETRGKLLFAHSSALWLSGNPTASRWSHG
jgi:site-specific recombinase XerD